MKSPMHQRPDDEARELNEKFIAKHSRKAIQDAVSKASKPAPTAGKSAPK